jgi:glycosyltransferase involved in cell wall biosynthesis
MTKVSIVVPLYNEEEMFPLYIKKASELFKDNDKYSFDYVFVNDGSKDKTLE